MDNCLTKLLNYPISHMSKIKDLTRDEIILKDTAIFPAYPFMLASSVICNLMLGCWMIYYFFTRDIHQCYDGVTLGIQILACVYPLYQVIMFLTLIISIATTESICLRYALIGLFTILTTPFGFSGLGVVYVCMVHFEDPNALPYSFLTENYFVQIIVYATLVFFLLYIILVPLMTFLNEWRNGTMRKSSCDCCICFFYTFFQMLLFFGILFFFALLFSAIPLLFYLLNGLSSMERPSEQEFYGFSITCIVAPIGIFVVVQLFTHFIGCGEEEMEVEDGEKELGEAGENKSTTKSKEDLDVLQMEDTKREVLLDDIQSKNFADTDFQKS